MNLGRLKDLPREYIDGLVAESTLPLWVVGGDRIDGLIEGIGTMTLTLGTTEST